MANRRSIKKDIQFIIHDLIDECCAYIILKGDEKEAQINVIIDQSVEVYDDLMKRVNNHNNLSGKEVKAHFNAIYSDLEEKSIELTKALNKSIAA
ncbi:MAG: hypothetical protein ACJAUV_000455 [Flavobacteriales bacterium]|jgi:hypothetical protein